MQTDAVMGQIIDAVDEAGITDNTLIIVSSDNGCSRAANFKQLEAAGHLPVHAIEVQRLIFGKAGYVSVYSPLAGRY